MGTKIRCLKCNDIIEGDRLGHLISCSCGACFIDETPYYYRIGGDPEFITVFDNDGNEKGMIQEAESHLKIPDRIDRIEYYLDIAETVAERSTCLDSNYGAIIVKNDEVISTGYNGAPRGRKNCCDLKYCTREKLNIPRGERYELCRSVHAEQNAIISAERNKMIGSTLYLVGKDYNTGKYVENARPCALCKRMIINSGIETVIVRDSKKKYTTINVQDFINNDESLDGSLGY